MNNNELSNAIPSGDNDGSQNSFYAIPEDVTTISGLMAYLKLEGDDRRDFDRLIKTIEENIGIIWNVPHWVYDVDTLNEWFGDSFYLGNVLKTFWLNIGLRHKGTCKSRERTKRNHYFDRYHEMLVR